MRLISWNVNGLRACLNKGFLDFVHVINADVICLQETKVQAGQVALELPGYHQYWNYADKKGYSGTAVFTKVEPLSVTYDFGEDVHRHEGRVITAEYPDFYLVCCYTPNSQDELRRLDYRMQWEDDLRDYLCSLDLVKPVVYCGDLNVAHEEIDLKNPKTNRLNPGFSDEERGKMTELLGSGFIDTFRALHPDAVDAYSWWSYRAASRERNVGWRIDYFIASERLRERIETASILPEVLGSDHCPVMLELRETSSTQKGFSEMRYEDLVFKIPQESPTYKEDSAFVIKQITSILDERMASNDNKIIINTNLVSGLPLENINKIAGPMIEAWAGEVFAGIRDNGNNKYHLINVETQERLGMADIILQFRKGKQILTGNVDVKATANDIPNSGKGPNITSFSRIRTSYVIDPDFLFIILSIKHRVYSERNPKTGLVDGIMEVVNYNAYDLKYISDADISYNPALGTGQIQIKDIHYVTYQYRTTWQMCQLLDQKYLHSSRRTIDDFYREAMKNKWIKE